MGKPKAPPAPDYASIAKQQGAVNQATAVTEFGLNNADQYTPWGSKTLEKLPGSTLDDPRYKITTALDPADQRNLDAQRSLESGLLSLGPTALGTAENILGTRLPTENLPPMAYQVDANGQKQLDYSKLPGSVYDVGDTGDIRQRMEDAAWGKYISRAAPMMQQQTSDLNTRLANMGGVTTSPGAMRAGSQLMQSQGDQARQAIFDSILQGGNAAQQEQGMRLNAANLWNTSRGQDAGLLAGQTAANNQTTQQGIQNAFANANLTNASRTQAINEQAQLRQMPLNELMAMISGTQVNSPQFQPVIATNIQPAPIFDAAKAQQQAAQDAFNTSSGTYNSMIGAIGSIGGGFAGRPSDRRLKSHIVRVGLTPGGVPLYEYDIGGHRERGVMAQDMLILRPSAVAMGEDGYLMVDYAQVV
jgi:hypothetical protein